MILTWPRRKFRICQPKLNNVLVPTYLFDQLFTCQNAWSCTTIPNYLLLVHPRANPEALLTIASQQYRLNFPCGNLVEQRGGQAEEAPSYCNINLISNNFDSHEILKGLNKAATKKRSMESAKGSVSLEIKHIKLYCCSN